MLRSGEGRIDADFKTACELLSSTEMRSIVVTNMLEDYGPTPAARAALETLSPGSLQIMLPTMSMMPRDERSWVMIGKKVLQAKCGACQQCVAAVLAKLYELSTHGRWTSTVRLVHVKGHHFIVVGNPGEKEFIIDLWVQNLHRPDTGTAWSVMVFFKASEQAAWYVKRTWDEDLVWTP